MCDRNTQVQCNKTGKKHFWRIKFCPVFQALDES